VALAVLVAISVGLIVLLVVADEILQGEAVVGGDEVDARVRQASPFQNALMASRYFPFHSVQRTGKLPT
jgi:hypothetical protein